MAAIRQSSRWSVLMTRASNVGILGRPDLAEGRGSASTLSTGSVLGLFATRAIALRARWSPSSPSVRMITDGSPSAPGPRRAWRPGSSTASDFSSGIVVEVGDA